MRRTSRESSDIRAQGNPSRVARRLALGVLGACLALLPTCSPNREMVKIVSTAEFGEVEIHGNPATIQGCFVVFSGGEGINEQDRDAVRKLTGAHNLTALIDTHAALEKLKDLQQDQECLQLTGAIEWLVRNAEHDYQCSRYQPPMLVGRGVGAALVYLILAQAPPLAFAGGLSADFTPVVDLYRTFCGTATDHLSHGTQQLKPMPGFRCPWRLGGTRTVSEAAAAFAREHTLLNHEPSRGTFPVNSLSNLYLAAADQTGKGDRRAVSDSLKDLPVVEVAAEATNETMVIIYSGDGGWRDIDKTLGDLLKTKGYAVVGVDSLRYFWHRRTPEETAADLARIITHYRKAWHVDRVALIGYSFGADILPLAYNRLPASVQSSVVVLSLLAPSRAGDLEIHLSEWYHSTTHPQALPLAPEISRIDPLRLQCIYGKEEADSSLCTDATMRDAERVERPGSHHFDRDYAALAEIIAAKIHREIETLRPK